MSQPARWRSPMGAPQSGHGLSFLRRLPCPHNPRAKPYTASCAIVRWSPREAVERCARRGQVIQTSCRWAGQPLDRAVTAISPLTRSLERQATFSRTRPLPCHHPLTGDWDGSLISTRSHWLISSRTTEANASRFSAQIAKRWEPGRASNDVKVTIGFTCPRPHVWQRLAITELLNRNSDAFGDGFCGAAALWIILGKTG